MKQELKNRIAAAKPGEMIYLSKEEIEDIGIKSFDPNEHPSILRKRSLLEEAIKACTGDRQLNYGAPKDNFLRIAILWNAWFEIRMLGGHPMNRYEIEPWEVAILCDLLKTARLANSPTHRDSWLDKAGYAACGADITEAK